MMTTIWDVLGIQPTDDEREIRRAYARELKLRRPDQDPQGFQELREAFDSAKRYASSEIPPVQEQEQEQEQVTLYDYPEPTQPADENQQFASEAVTVPDVSWSQNELWSRAHSLSILLIKDELKGLGELHQYLDNEIPDALEALQAFSLMLARELSEQPGLDRNLLNEVSAVMHWQLDSYNSSPLSHWIILALEEQISLTEQENYWQKLSWKYLGSRLKQLKWRLLTEKGASVPWWGRLIPDLFLQLDAQVSEIRQLHPALQERLNPLLLNELSQPGRAITWETIIAILFWGNTARIMGQITPQIDSLPALMLVVIASFLWGYPALLRWSTTGGVAEKCTQVFFWLVSVALLVIATYYAWQAINTFREESPRPQIAAGVLILVMLSIGSAFWQNRSEWRSVPIIIILTILKFPIVFIRKLSPLVSLLGLALLPILYAIIVDFVFLGN